MTRLTAREQRLVALGLLVLVLVLVWALAVQPLVEGFQARAAERERLAETLRQDARLLRLLPAYRREAAVQGRDLSDYAFPTRDPAAARTAGEMRLVSAITASGGLLHAVREQPAPPGQVRLRAEVALTLPKLVGLLHVLQDSKPYAVVDGLTVAAADPAAPQPTSPLEVRVDVLYAYAAPRP